MGKGENAGYQHFLLSPQCFQTQSVSKCRQKEKKKNVWGSGINQSLVIHRVGQWFHGENTFLWVNHGTTVTRYVLTDHSQGRSLSFSPICRRFECITTSDWLNRMV